MSCNYNSDRAYSFVQYLRSYEYSDVDDMIQSLESQCKLLKSAMDLADEIMKKADECEREGDAEFKSVKIKLSEKEETLKNTPAYRDISEPIYNEQMQITGYKHYRIYPYQETRKKLQDEIDALKSKSALLIGNSRKYAAIKSRALSNYGSYQTKHNHYLDALNGIKAIKKLHEDFVKGVFANNVENVQGVIRDIANIDFSQVSARGEYSIDFIREV